MRVLGPLRAGPPILLVFHVLRLAVAMVLLLGGLAKLSSAGEFVVVLRGYEILPEWLIRPTAIALPTSEILIGALLISRRFRELGGALALGLLTTFALVSAVIAGRGSDVECGCFGGFGPVRTITYGAAWISLIMGIAGFVASREPLPSE
jgi:methylamine utilization protein MauE